MVREQLSVVVVALTVCRGREYSISPPGGPRISTYDGDAEIAILDASVSSLYSFESERTIEAGIQRQIIAKLIELVGGSIILHKYELKEMNAYGMSITENPNDESYTLSVNKW